MAAWFLVFALLGCRGSEPPPAVQAPETTEPRPPNVLLVIIDSLRADRATAQREDGPLAPTLARLAAEGAQFERAYSQSGWTMPGVTSILTGRYPPTMSIDDRGEMTWISEQTRTLPGILHLYGYQTAVFWGRTIPGGFEDLSRDFDHVHRLETADLGEQPFRQGVQAWLEEPPAEPWFVLLHNMDLHCGDPPPPAEALNRSAPQEPNLTDAGLDLIQRVVLASHGEEVARVETIGAYDDVLRHYDGELGAILTSLEARGALADTVVVISSNHGEALWEHGFMGHGFRHFEPVLRVPLIWWDPMGPHGAPPIQQPVQGIDLAPTLLARVGATVDQGMDGQSLLPLLGLAEGDYRDRPIFSYSNPRGQAVIRGSDKLLRYPGRADDPRQLSERSREDRRMAYHLYDLDQDPGETMDLALQQRETTSELAALLRAWVRGLEQRAEDAASVPTDPAFRQTLQERGYWEHVVPEGEAPSGSP